MSSPRGRYPGAQPFADDEVSRKVFFGREQAARALTDLILANRMVVVFGKSGLGKSSLLSAGISQRLRDQGRLPLIVRVNDIQRGPFVSVLEGIQVAAERQKVICSWQTGVAVGFLQDSRVLAEGLAPDASADS